MAIVQFLNRKYSTVRCASFCLNRAYLQRRDNQRDIWIQCKYWKTRRFCGHCSFLIKSEITTHTREYSTVRVMVGVNIAIIWSLGWMVTSWSRSVLIKESLCSSMEMTYFQIYLRYRIPIRCYTFTWSTMYQPWRQFRLKYQVVDKCSDERNGIVANSLKRVKSKSVVRITNCWWNEFQFGGVLLSN